MIYGFQNKVLKLIIINLLLTLAISNTSFSWSSTSTYSSSSVNNYHSSKSSYSNNSYNNSIYSQKYNNPENEIKDETYNLEKEDDNKAIDDMLNNLDFNKSYKGTKKSCKDKNGGCKNDDVCIEDEKDGVVCIPRVKNTYYSSFSASSQSYEVFSDNSYDSSSSSSRKGRCHICFYQDLDPNTGGVYQCEKRHCDIDKKRQDLVALKREYLKDKCDDSKNKLKPICTKLKYQINLLETNLKLNGDKKSDLDENGMLINRCRYQDDFNGGKICVNSWQNRCPNFVEGALDFAQIGYSSVIDKYGSGVHLARFQNLLSFVNKKNSHEDFAKNVRKEKCKELFNITGDKDIEKRCLNWSFEAFKSYVKELTILNTFDSTIIQNYIKDVYMENHPECIDISVQIESHSNPQSGREMDDIILDSSSDDFTRICSIEDNGCSGLGVVDGNLMYMNEVVDPKEGKTQCQKLQEKLRRDKYGNIDPNDKIEIIGHALVSDSYIDSPYNKIIVTKDGCRVEYSPCERFENDLCYASRLTNTTVYCDAGNSQIKKLCCKSGSVADKWVTIDENKYCDSVNEKKGFFK